MSHSQGHSIAHHHHHDLHPPKALLAACFAMIIFAVLGTAFVQITGIGDSKDTGGIPVESISLTFADREDGAVIAYEAGSGDVVKIWEPTTGGFVRTAMRAMARSRYLDGIGSEPAFLLYRTEQGRLLLEDPTTGKHISLEAFGQDNEESFAVLLDWKGRTQ